MVLTSRISGIDTTASHRGNHFFIKRRSDEFYNSELVACPLDNVAETTVLLPHRERYLRNIVVHISDIILRYIVQKTQSGQTLYKRELCTRLPILFLDRLPTITVFSGNC